MYGKETHVSMGSAKPSKPESHATGGVAGSGNHGPGKYHPEGAAKFLKGQDGCAPHNDGPMKKAVGSKSIA